MDDKQAKIRRMLAEAGRDPDSPGWMIDDTTGKMFNLSSQEAIDAAYGRIADNNPDSENYGTPVFMTWSIPFASDKPNLLMRIMRGEPIRFINALAGDDADVMVRPRHDDPGRPRYRSSVDMIAPYVPNTFSAARNKYLSLGMIIYGIQYGVIDHKDVPREAMDMIGRYFRDRSVFEDALRANQARMAVRINETCPKCGRHLMRTTDSGDVYVACPGPEGCGWSEKHLSEF